MARADRNGRRVHSGGIGAGRTVKLKLELGAVAVNVTVTVEPAAMEGHALEFSVIVTPVVVPTVVGMVPD